MDISTQECKIKHKDLGMVSGSIVKAKFFVKDWFASIRVMFGMEVTEYSDMLKEVREIAIQRMIEEAEVKGADGVYNVRLQTSQVISQAAELFAYGTAVKYEG